MEKPDIDYKAKARKIIEENKYVTLATVKEDGSPWGTAVFYAYDRNYNFYFLSAVDSQHAENMLENGKVTGVIFDSSQPLDNYDSVIFEGTAKRVEGKELAAVIKLYANRVFPNSDMAPLERYPPEDFEGAAEFGFFKITPKTTYTTGVDRRVEVNLNKNAG